jgi:hypothetical protein
MLPAKEEIPKAGNLVLTRSGLFRSSTVKVKFANKLLYLGHQDRYTSIIGSWQGTEGHIHTLTPGEYL